jgi:lysophospholipase L1-like esterase
VLRWLVGSALAAGVGLAAQGWRAVAPLPFHAGLLLCALGTAGLSVAAARRGREAAVWTLNTLVCLLVGVVLVDRVWFGRERTGEGELVSYSFNEAGGRPEVFLRWHARALEEQKRSRGNTMPDPRGVNPHVLTPGPGKIFDSTWWINSLGFRGPELEIAKGDRFRIIALGESTTFGDTLRAEDRTWPEILETRIANELVCEKPVQVINAGVPGWTLANQLARLKADVYPLAPDLIVSYHGYNGFPYLLSEIPAVQIGNVPEAPPRPSPFMAQVESAARVWWFKRRYDAARKLDAKALEMDVHLSRYAELYRQLVTETQARGIGLVLCSFDMAVTADSPDAVIRFYEPVFPDLRAGILANRLHTLLVTEIGAKFGVPVIDTSPGLNGAWQDAYADPIHFTQIGRERLAANIFAGLRPLLAASRAGCRPKAPANGVAAASARTDLPTHAR